MALSGIALLAAWRGDQAMIAVTYYCPSCRKRVVRMKARRTPFHRSFCETTGREVRMRKLKSQKPK
jgi:hypothetical protein